MNLEVKIDFDLIQQKVNEAATQGIIKAVNEYFTGYNSPFQENVKAQLNKVYSKKNLKIPDVLALLNEKLEKEAMVLANTAFPTTYMKQIKELIIGYIPPKVTTRDIFVEFIGSKTSPEVNEFSGYIYKNDEYSWYNAELKYENEVYNFTLHKNHNSNSNTYKILSLTNERYNSKLANITVESSDLKVNFPITLATLDDDFRLYLAKLYLSGTEIEITDTEFDSDMFNEIEY